FSIGALIGIIVPGAVARKLVRDAEREMWKNADFEAARNLSQKNSTKPNQIHHYATNKSKTYTHQMEEIAKKYGLDLNGKWNKDLLLHQGRHPNEYHEYVLNSMKQFDEVAQGNVDIFLQLYEKMKAYIKANPDMLYKAYWLQ
ncbi:AHH domain-containing protein, partial [Roseburia intestinalis]